MMRLNFVISVFVLTAPASHAQVLEQGETTPAPTRDQLGDIVVTAQRRSENLQDTPVSVTALDERLLNDRQIERTIDIAQSVPGLYINNISASPSSLVVFLRGAGEQTGGLATAESPVGIYLDDVYLARLANGNLDLADVERIEVLRGPQGTLYGRNTMTGALKIVTHRPGDTLWVRAEAGYGTFDQVRAKAAISGPLADGFAGLVSGARQVAWHRPSSLSWCDQWSAATYALGTPLRSSPRSVRALLSIGNPRMRLTRCRRMSSANIGPHLFHHIRTVSVADVDPALEQQVFDIP